MVELTNAECDSLVALLVRVGRPAALLIRVGRPHAPDEAADMEQWVSRLARGRRVDIHGGDLLA